MKLNQKLAKRFLAVALSFAMVVTSLFVMPTATQAANGATIGRYSSVKADNTVSVKIKNLSKKQYAKVSVEGTAKDGITIKNTAGKTITANTKIQGTGKAITLKVSNEAVSGKSYKLVVKTYNKATNKIVRTYTTKSTFVYKTATAINIAEETYEMNIGDTFDFAGKREPQGATTKVVWTSSKPEVATVAAGGVVTAVAAGETTITATAGKVSDTVKVTVKAAEATLTGVEATGAKKLTATLNTTAEVTAADIVVTKGVAKPNVESVVVDGTNVLITLGSKMTAGTYTVTYKGIAKEVTVKDETLTSFELVGTNLVERYAVGDTIGSNTNKNTAASATISYIALNQYGEKMVLANAPTVTCSFGSSDAAASDTASEAYEAGNVTTPVSSNLYTGKVIITKIPAALAIAGQTGSLVLVDSQTGVSLSTNVSYAAKATAASVEIAGLYNENKGKIQDMTAGETVADYSVVMIVKDQYGNVMDAETLKAATNLTITPVAGLTNVVSDSDFANADDITIGDVDYVVLPLSADESPATAVAGTFYLNIVNTNKGLLANTSFTVKDSTIVKSISVAPTDAIYAEQRNEFEFTVIDQNSNEITDYATLMNCNITFSSSVGADGFTFEKQADGTAKLFYTPDADGLAGKESETRVITVTANGTTSSNYVVKTLTTTVYAEKVATTITGIKSTQSVACANSTNATLKLSKANLIIEDQFQNVMTGAQLLGADVTYEVANEDSGFANVSSGTSFGRTVSLVPTDNEIGYATVKVTVGTTDFSFKVYTVDATKATDLKIASVNGGYPYWVGTESSSPIAKNKIVVTGKINGKTVTIPGEQYVISGDTYAPITTAEGKVSKTATVEVTVDTNDGTKAISTVLTADYTYSNKPAVLSAFEAADPTNVVELDFTSTDTTIDANVLSMGFAFESQYGGGCDISGIKYNVVVKEDSTTGVTIAHNNTNGIVISGTAEETVTLYVTATYNGVSDTQAMKFKFAATSELATADKAAVDVISVSDEYADIDAVEEAIFDAMVNGTCWRLDWEKVNDTAATVIVTYWDGQTSELAFTNILDTARLD